MAHIARFADDKVTVVVFANLVPSNVSKIAHQVAGIYNPELAPTPTNKEKEPKD